MKNKKVRNALMIVVGVLILLMLMLGIIMVSQKKNVPASTGENEETEQYIIVEDDDTTVIWQREDFKDKTTDKAETSKATQKGGSETLGIIYPEDATDRDASDETEINWLEGVW